MIALIRFWRSLIKNDSVKSVKYEIQIFFSYFYSSFWTFFSLIRIRIFGRSGSGLRKKVWSGSGKKKPGSETLQVKKYFFMKKCITGQINRLRKHPKIQYTVCFNLYIICVVYLALFKTLGNYFQIHLELAKLFVNFSQNSFLIQLGLDKVSKKIYQERCKTNLIRFFHERWRVLGNFAKAKKSVFRDKWLFENGQIFE